jgi:hypothetical protein
MAGGVKNINDPDHNQFVKYLNKNMLPQKAFYFDVLGAWCFSKVGQSK